MSTVRSHCTLRIPSSMTLMEASVIIFELYVRGMNACAICETLAMDHRLSTTPKTVNALLNEVRDKLILTLKHEQE
jgi:hypothetical protein